MRVLLTDGDQRSALAVTRSLGRAGVEVIVGATGSTSLAGSSRYCTRRVVTPSPRDDERGFVQAIAREVRSHGVDFVIPIADLATAVLAENRDLLAEHARISVPEPDRFWAAADKNQLHRLAARIGVPSPTLHFIEDPDQALRLQDDVPFPCVVKPARSFVRHQGGWARTSVRRVASKREYVTFFEDPTALRAPCMIQSEIQGDGCGLFALCREGEPLVMFAHRRIREKPPWGGVSVLRESAPVDPAMGDAATRLLREIGWHGVAMVEFKKEASTGTAYLMEVNARFWGSLQLAIDAGVDFPFLLVGLYQGASLAIPASYRVGVRSRWLLGDVDHLLARIRHRPERALVPWPRFLADFFWPFHRNTRLEIESWSDPKPAWHEITKYLRDLLGPAGKRAARPSEATPPASRGLNELTRP